MMALMLLGMAASYDPDPEAKNGFRLPFDLQSGQLIPERWRVWLKHDPINQIKRYAPNLKKLRGLFMDCGHRDQFHIHYGSRQLSQAMLRPISSIIMRNSTVPIPVSITVLMSVCLF